MKGLYRDYIGVIITLPSPITHHPIITPAPNGVLDTRPTPHSSLTTHPLSPPSHHPFRPAPNGVLDTRLGVADKAALCKTCRYD